MADIIAVDIIQVIRAVGRLMKSEFVPIGAPDGALPFACGIGLPTFVGFGCAAESGGGFAFLVGVEDDGC